MGNKKFVNAHEAIQIYHNKNIKNRLYKTNAPIWYNKTRSSLVFLKYNCSSYDNFVNLLVKINCIRMHGIQKIKFRLSFF
jgi:hypothetical protein